MREISLDGTIYSFLADQKANEILSMSYISLDGTIYSFLADQKANEI